MLVLVRAIEPPNVDAILCNSSRSPSLIGTNSVRSRADLLVWVLDNVPPSMSFAVLERVVAGRSISSSLYECPPRSFSSSLRMFSVLMGANSRGSSLDAMIMECGDGFRFFGRKSDQEPRLKSRSA